MSNKSKDIIKKDDIVQAILVADTFDDEFVPISSDVPLVLLPVINKPLIDYTLEFLSLGGIEETFLFCCSHVDAIKSHINKSIKEAKEWTSTMKVHIIVSESCHSFGDCLRDLDQKALLRGNFVLLHPGTLSNIKLLPIIKKHNEITKKDKGAAMSLIFQESEIGHMGRDPRDDIIVAVNSENRILFHRKLGHSSERKIEFPLEIFLDNSCVSLHHNLKDTHIAICSPSVLPLFSDNFDFQTKDDFVRGLLMNEEILGSTVYCHLAKGSNYGGAVTSWRMYQSVSQELQNKWVYPLQAPNSNRYLKNRVIVANDVSISDKSKIVQSIIGEKVRVGKNVQIENSFIFSKAKIDNDVMIKHSVIGPNCHIKAKSKVVGGCILGRNVVIENGQFIEDCLVQSTLPEDCDDKDKLGKCAFRLKIGDDNDTVGIALARKLSRLHISDNFTEESEDDDAFSDSEEEELSYTQSPVPDDTKLFFTEVIDSLQRGFEDELHCDNLILEINSSRYAYNVTVKEVNFHVIKAILLMSLRLPTGAQYFSRFVHLLSYFAPILKNYIRNDSAMLDTLQAIEDVAISSENVNEKWVMFVSKWLYDKDFVTEDVILEWFKTLDKTSKFYKQVKPFTDWLQEAEEASSSESE